MLDKKKKEIKTITQTGGEVRVGLSTISPKRNQEPKIHKPKDYEVVSQDFKVKDSSTALEIKSFPKYSMENNSRFSFAL